MTADRPFKPFAEPDEVNEVAGVREEIVRFGHLRVGRVTHSPGWRWSVDVKPLVGTARCESRHFGVLLSGRWGLELIDGSRFEIGAPSVFDVPPGHDGWVIGDEPTVSIEWMGLGEWLLPTHAERILLTLLFTDIVDSTGHAMRLGDTRWRKLLGTHDELVRDIVSQFRGREMKATGDGFLIAFDGPARAIRTAIAIRHRLADVGLDVRQAVHVGEAELADNDVRGVAVHEAARIVAEAAPGQIVASGTTQLLASSSGLAFNPLTARPLKGLPGEYALFEVVDAGAAEAHR